MSYVRLGSDGSDVYVYDDIRYGLMCCFCALSPESTTATGQDGPAMVAHLAEHRAAGHVVPERVDAAILADFPPGG